MPVEETKRMKIEIAGETGFCLGVRRAVDTLEKAAHERGAMV